jgi:short-subunit dehydrogenase
MKAISEQVIVLTGATSGIGLATARMAAERGAKVVLSSRNEDELRALTEDIRQKGGEAIFVKVDVTKFEDLMRLRDEALKAFGRIDTWINNAGTSLYGYLMDTPIEDERQLFETNFWGTRLGCQVAVDCMKQSGGTIINLGSEVSVAAQPLLGIYSATKHAVKAMTEALRSELRDRDIPIEVSLVRPTAIDTPFAEHATNDLKVGEPSLPSPLYSPDVAAEAILKCAENPQRDVYVGGPAKLSAIIDTFFPQVKDMVAETRMKEMKKGTETPHKEENEGLYHASAEESKKGSNEGTKLNNSLYTDLTTLSFIKSITHSARKSFENFRRAG